MGPLKEANLSLRSIKFFKSDLPEPSGLLRSPENAEVVLKAVPTKSGAQKPAKELSLGSEDLPDEIGEEGDYLKEMKNLPFQWNKLPESTSAAFPG